MRYCSIEECKDKLWARGWCSSHYHRWNKYGDPSLGRRRQEHHGMTHTREYKIWHGMTRRCTSKNLKSYKNYGGRGIKVCERWQESFMNFYADMGRRPSPMHSVERLDNNGDYEPSNCVWATPLEQSINKRAPSTSKSGYRGVSKYRGKWRARIKFKDVEIQLGTFGDILDAIEARKRAEDVYYEPIRESLLRRNNLTIPQIKHEPRKTTRA